LIICAGSISTYLIFEALRPTGRLSDVTAEKPPATRIWIVSSAVVRTLTRLPWPPLLSWVSRLPTATDRTGLPPVRFYPAEGASIRVRRKSRVGTSGRRSGR
jgi:hypothetical protein